MDNATQRAKIINYCNKHGSITVRDAFELLAINSPTKRISEIRKNEVRTVTETRIKDSGEKVRYARYFITAPQV